GSFRDLQLQLLFARHRIGRALQDACRADSAGLQLQPEPARLSGDLRLQQQPSLRGSSAALQLLLQHWAGLLTMIVRTQLRWRRSRDGVFLVAALVSALSLAIHAQQSVSGAAMNTAPNPAGSQNSSGDRVTLDSVAAVVNGELILESDVDAERRFRAFQPFSEPQPASRDRLMERLIDRTLILQQMALQP